MPLRKGFVREDDDRIAVPLENIWARVRRWARRNHHPYDPSYGVVGVGPV